MGCQDPKGPWQPHKPGKEIICEATKSLTQSRLAGSSRPGTAIQFSRLQNQGSLDNTPPHCALLEGGLLRADNPQLSSQPQKTCHGKQEEYMWEEVTLAGQRWTWVSLNLSLPSASCRCQGQTSHPSTQVGPTPGSLPQQRGQAGHCPPK